MQNIEFGNIDFAIISMYSDNLLVYKRAMKATPLRVEKNSQFFPAEGSTLIFISAGEST